MLSNNRRLGIYAYLPQIEVFYKNKHSHIVDISDKLLGLDGVVKRPISFVVGFWQAFDILHV